MNTFILTFDILRSSIELGQLHVLLGEENIFPIGVNCHAFLIRFEGTALDFHEHLKRSESVYPYEDFFIAEVEKWSGALRGSQQFDISTFLSQEPNRSEQFSFA